MPPCRHDGVNCEMPSSPPPSKFSDAHAIKTRTGFMTIYADISNLLAEKNRLHKAYMNIRTEAMKLTFFRCRRFVQQRLREMQDAWMVRKTEEIQGVSYLVNSGERRPPRLMSTQEELAEGYVECSNVHAQLSTQCSDLRIVRTEVETTLPEKIERVRGPSTSSISSLSEKLGKFFLRWSYCSVFYSLLAVLIHNFVSDYSHSSVDESRILSVLSPSLAALKPVYSYLYGFCAVLYLGPPTPEQVERTRVISTLPPAKRTIWMTGPMPVKRPLVSRRVINREFIPVEIIQKYGYRRPKNDVGEQTIPNLDSLRRDLLTRLIAEGRPVDSLLGEQQPQGNQLVDDHVRSCGVLFRGVTRPGNCAGTTEDSPTGVKTTPLTGLSDGYLSSSGVLFQCCGRRFAQALDTADYAVSFVDGVVPSEEGRFRKAVVEQNEGVSDYWHQMTLLSLQLSAVDAAVSKSSGGDVTRDSVDSVPTKNSDLASEGEANDSEKKRPSTMNPDITVSGEQASATVPPTAETGSQEMPTATTTEPPQPSPQEQVLAQFKRFDNFSLPDIGLMSSPKLVEKLLKRQLENALEVEHQRRLMCPESQIQTGFIIF
ncbi:unnamed protein product [Schistocephalus solidus]|uniref:IQ calmodulin-binding motif protein n=1 Tax=Schistocephalus solidus TaxID=70667 RepID=A0A183SZU6_SCHSO|nr:unnamed protein product [Schistocephalus solidus]